MTMMMIIMMMMMTIMMLMPIRTLTRQAGSLGIIWRALLKREQSSAPLDVKTTWTSEWKIFEKILKENLSTLWLFLHRTQTLTQVRVEVEAALAQVALALPRNAFDQRKIFEMLFVDQVAETSCFAAHAGGIFDAADVFKDWWKVLWKRSSQEADLDFRMDFLLECWFQNHLDFQNILFACFEDNTLSPNCHRVTK